MNTIIEFSNVTVSYRENVALHNVSLKVKEGAFLGVIGPNGSGKTTLLTTVNGLGKVRSGRVKVFGLELKSHQHYIRKNIGYVPQSSNIDPRLPITVYEVVKIGRVGKRGMGRRLNHSDYDAIDTALAVVGITNFKGRPIGHLSSGEKQKVAIARAIAQQPKIMLFDEPTSNLDPGAQQDIIMLMNSIYRETGSTIILVTHILQHLPESCKEVICLKQGEVIHAGTYNETLDSKLLASLYECSPEALGS
ncbi:MAG: metal ABC transporter ATP-binding protein [Deltaproteobacteria bacterium]|nr:metal ABC transporter ATP-binding protein [Deltaproteobacteria bacterium]